MGTRAADVLKLGTNLFSNRSSVDSLWEELALQFYPERADFLSNRHEGDEFHDHLFSSTPVLARRELGNTLSASLRPRSQDWFSIHVDDEDVDEQDDVRKYLERLTDIQRAAMYERRAGFVRSTKQADHDFVSFGNAVLHLNVNTDRNGLLFRNYHLRDCAWSENAEGTVDAMHRKWEPTARQLMAHFPNTVSSEVRKAETKAPETKFKVRHAVVPSRLLPQEKPGKKFPFTSLFIELETENILEEVGLEHFPFVVPRWHTVAGSVYGLSMATAVLLPDGRTMQAVMRTIREAGEKYVDPPMVAVSDAIRGDIALYPGGVTTADIEYDERLGDVLRPINQDRSGMPIGFEVAEALKEDIAKGFFLDKIQLPDTSGDKTAFEIRRRIEEQIRGQSPIFEPIESEYNDPLCETTFNVLTAHGAFPVDDMPEILEGADIKFQFRSPLADLADQNEAETYAEVIQRILIPAAEIDPAQMEQVDLTQSTRDAMRAMGWKAKWFKDPSAVEQKREELAKAQAMQQGMETLGAAGAVAEQGGKGLSALENADGGDNTT